MDDCGDTGCLSCAHARVLTGVILNILRETAPPDGLSFDEESAAVLSALAHVSASWIAVLGNENTLDKFARIVTSCVDRLRAAPRESMRVH